VETGKQGEVIRATESQVRREPRKKQALYQKEYFAKEGLCSSGSKYCNTGIGSFSDNPEILESAARYIRSEGNVAVPDPMERKSYVMRGEQEDYSGPMVWEVCRLMATRSFLESATGMHALRGSLSGETGVFCCAGTSLANYDDSAVPISWSRFAVNAGIRKIAHVADFFVLADIPIVDQYASICRQGTMVLAMHEAGRPCLERMGQTNAVYTVDSTPEPVTYGDGLRFFSRGTVLIGALEMARYMGVRTAYVFGLDCYRTRSAYYYDGRTPPKAHEAKPARADLVPGLPFEAYVTPCLRRMIEKLDLARSAGLWDDLDVWCVGSPWSQQRAIPKMTVEEFKELVAQ